MHDFCGALRMMFFICCSVTREKVFRLGPQKTEKSGSSLSLWIFIVKKSPNLSGRSTVGIELGRVLSFFLPDN